MNGSAPGDGIFQTPLFGQTGLENTLHNITLTNAGIQPDRSLDFLDLDFVGLVHDIRLFDALLTLIN